MLLCPLCGEERAYGECCDNGHPAVRLHTNTYVYRDYRDNLIVDRDSPVVQRKRRYVGHENSEDALTWNVFRSLELGGLLAGVSRRVFATQGPVEAYYWTRNAADEPWPPLLDAGNTLEAHIKSGQRSEPDVVLVDVQGQTVVFIEAKFSSKVQTDPPKWFYAGGGPYTPQYRERILTNYGLAVQDASPFASGWDLERVIRHGYYQLMRHVLFAHYLAQRDYCHHWSWKVVSLIVPTHRPDQLGQALSFAELLGESIQEQYGIVTWYDLYRALLKEIEGGSGIGTTSRELVEYLRQKTQNGENARLTIPHS